MDIGPHSPTILKSKWADMHRLPHFYSWAYCFVHTKSLKSGALLAWIENIQWHSLKSLTNLTLICWKCDTTSNSPSRKLIALDCQRLDFCRPLSFSCFCFSFIWEEKAVHLNQAYFFTNFFKTQCALNSKKFSKLNNFSLNLNFLA